MIVKPPVWYRTFYVCAFMACLLLGLASIFAFDRTTAVAFGFPVLLLAAFMLLIAIMSLTRRLELRADQLYSVDITGKKQVAISEIGSMRLSSMGNGMSRVEFVRWDGAPAFSRIRRAWPTTDLLHLAERMDVSVQSA